jgi:hypothetical protein
MTKLILDRLFISGIQLRRRVYFLPLAALAPLSIFWPASAQAQTWLASPGSGDWNTAANWNPAIVPNAQTANLVFGTSAAATFDDEFSNVTSSYAGKGVVRYAW